MSDHATKHKPEELVFKYELDSEPDKVWRALSVEEFREKWLPAHALVSSKAVSTKPGREVSYRLRDDDPPFLESIVTFQISPGEAGGTSLKIIHVIADRGTEAPLKAANCNGPPLMLAA